MRVIRVIKICEEISAPEAALIINAALFLSNRIRKDAIVFIKVSDIGIVKIEGPNARRLYPDSESLVGSLKALLKGRAPRGVSLVNRCPEIASYAVFCPGMDIENIDEYIVIDPSACNFRAPYTRDAKVAVLNIELDRALYLYFHRGGQVSGVSRYGKKK